MNRALQYRSPGGLVVCLSRQRYLSSAGYGRVDWVHSPSWKEDMRAGMWGTAPMASIVRSRGLSLPPPVCPVWDPSPWCCPHVWWVFLAQLNLI